ncbi:MULTISPECIES: HlyD family type I secretion periplasmic adaptor subunit [unclassified Duganella]|uniref:HlyD family type I secretion periplasmic adaptor subunit n=1 Tax=unclassified Duganella TaxID=2636909 RepID=UPI000E34B389|nr:MULTISPECIES: HlyD family type I secretion periplasmic adaptor subunit [unclassified Duganella]RFP11897.1 HlyD family type I secretion periplasmic adaptor subunit [Duganella sp. BJB475]RFP31463.1 HlyD family type I secretion periplasmic adaptor subunit [Duganella sp. BJB476]
MKSLVTKKEDAAEVITHDVTPLTVNTDAGAYAKFGWMIVLLGVCGFLLWAVFAPLDKGVPVSGVVVKEGNRKPVQHQAGGTLEALLVKDGDVVKAGQVVARMNPVQAQAQVEMNGAQYRSQLATEARLLAERAGKTTITYPPELLAARNDPAVAQTMALQEQLMLSRQMSLRSEMSAYEENLAGLKGQVEGLQASRASKVEQLAFVKEQVTNLRDLAKDGYVARSRLLDVERSYSQLVGAIAEDAGNIEHGKRQIAEIAFRRAQRTQEYQKEVSSQLADVQKDVRVNAGRMTALEFDLSNIEVKAPVDGVVVGLAAVGKGTVLPSGFRMMDVVPSGEALVVEAQLAINLIDKVKVGMPAELIFSAFNTNKTPHIPGQVIQVSADRSVDEHTGQPYYKIRTRVTPEGAKLIAAHKLEVQPGMPVEMFVKTGERTMMSYLLKPVFDRSKTSMTEE